jgi:hypothetical protein
MHFAAINRALKDPWTPTLPAPFLVLSIEGLAIGCTLFLVACLGFADSVLLASPRRYVACIAGNTVTDLKICSLNFAVREIAH